MWRKFCGWLLRILGWTVVDPVAPEDKCIILGVPHTSIWDFVISYLYYVSVGGKPYCMVKGELFWGPLGWLLRKMGGIPVDRKRGSNVALSVIKEMKAQKTVHLALAPEGTRKPVKRWKTGFHTIARTHFFNVAGQTINLDEVVRIMWHKDEEATLVMRDGTKVKTYTEAEYAVVVDMYGSNRSDRHMTKPYGND